MHYDTKSESHYPGIQPLEPWPEPKHKQDAELKKQLDKIEWPIEYGTISVQLRNGKPTLVKIERTVKLD